MSEHDPTTPIGDSPSPDHPTIDRRSMTGSTTATGFPPGSVIAGRYRIVALLGKGGMGAVYRADDLRLGQPVALKFVDLGSDTQSIETLYHEVRVARQVTHPNVCRVHDVVEVEGHRFIAMEYVDGEDLASLLRRIGRLPASKATDLAREIASGLAAAHAQNIVHRDLKPANVMIDGNGHAHVTDFGLASLSGADDGRIAGTPAYMAPEQVAGQPVTPRSDVYALGLLFHELFTGERVYGSASFAERRKQQTLTPRPISASTKDVDPAVDAVIAACLAEDPAKRPASARQVLAMLPGGDALDAAVAAGETPSPEMIAAAAETGIMPIRVVAVMVAAIALGLIAISWQSQSLLFTTMRKPPEVLMDRAAEIVARSGERLPARDEVYTFNADIPMLRSRWGGELTRDAFAALRPGVVHFQYRRSPSRMASKSAVVVSDIMIFQTARITLDDPPLEVPGSACIVFDQHGGLVEYRAWPSQRAAAPDWRPLLEATGIDMKTLVPAEPAARPPVPSDARAAWKGAFAGQVDPITIEAASLQGRPSWLRVSAPWNAPDSNTSRLQLGNTFFVMSLVMMMVFIVTAVVVTVRSLRRGRSDKIGAMRVAAYLGILFFAAWVIGAHHVLDPEDASRNFAGGSGQALNIALTSWVFYIALEPGVRRSWPRSLIGWTRLVTGRLTDPMVGREVLAGMCGGILAYEMFWVVRTFLHSPVRHSVRAQTIDPLRLFISNQLINCAEPVIVALGTIFVYMLSRRIAGRIGTLVIFVLLFAGYALRAPAIVLYLIVLMYLLLQWGILSGVVMVAMMSVLSESPLTLDTTAWYWPRALMMLTLLMALTLWAARLAIGRYRPRWQT